MAFPFLPLNWVQFYRFVCMLFYKNNCHHVASILSSTGFLQDSRVGSCPIDFDREIVSSSLGNTGLSYGVCMCVGGGGGGEGTVGIGLPNFHPSPLPFFCCKVYI